MDRKAVLEVRKLFDKNDCRIDRMRGCYVNGEKQIIADLQDQFYSFEDEELFQYCELFKKAVSGRIGRTLFNIEFPLAAEKEGGAQEKLYRLLKSELKDEALLQEFFQDMLSMLESNVKSDRTDLDLLFGCLLDWGLPLSMPYTSEQIEGCTVHTYNDGDLIACFDENIPDSVIKEIAKRQPLRAVFRDSSFNGSPAKINVGEIFKMRAPDTRVKVI